MKRFRNVSAIVTLLAGFITAVVMIINRYSLVSFLWILIGQIGRASCRERV